MPVLTVSIQYLTKPIEIFRDVNRILKPGGLFAVIFSNRMFPPKPWPFGGRWATISISNW